MPIVWVKRVYIKIPRMNKRIYRTVPGSVKEGFAVVTNIDNQNVVMQYIKHISLDAYGMVQKGLPQNSKNWGAHI
jgi:hypothetical protein